MVVLPEPVPPEITTFMRLAPAIFSEDDEGYGTVTAPGAAVPADQYDAVRLADANCPEAAVLLLDDPTKGVDVGAKAEIYSILADLRAAGTAIILYSSDDQELLELCDRVLVLHDGRVSAELAGDSLNHTELVTASMGTSGQG